VLTVVPYMQPEYTIILYYCILDNSIAAYSVYKVFHLLKI
jgi:hypothetical protein